MSNPFDFFDKIYCVNLPESVDRKEHMVDAFRTLNILDRVIFDAAPVPPSPIGYINQGRFTPGILGCSLSHLKIIFDAAYSNVNNFMIFEDDILFDDSVSNILNRLEKSINALPDDWDIFYLGGKPTDYLGEYSDSLLKVNGIFLGTYAYAVNRRAMNKFVNELFEKMMGNSCDSILGQLADAGNSFCVYPPLFTTKPGRSLVRNAHRDYIENTLKSWKKFTSNIGVIK